MYCDSWQPSEGTPQVRSCDGDSADVKIESAVFLLPAEDNRWKVGNRTHHRRL